MESSLFVTTESPTVHFFDLMVKHPHFLQFIRLMTNKPIGYGQMIGRITSLGGFPYSLTIVWLCLAVYLLLSYRKIQWRFNFKVLSDVRRFVFNISWYMNSSFHHVNLFHTLWWKQHHLVIHAFQLGRPFLALIVLFSPFPN